ncbi:MAG: SIMPL domain-containing protein [Acidobacteriota bacterium]
MLKVLTSRLANRRKTSFAIGLILLLVFAASCSSNHPPLTRVTVAGETSMKAQPDAALVVLSVITQNPQALNAQQDNARKSDAVIQALKASAGADPEIKTSDYTFQPQYDDRYNKLPKIIGYEARNSVMVTMGDLTKVGAVIDAASRAGANSVERVSFILRENSPARGQALAEATLQAMTKAQSIAQAMGGKVVRVIEEQEAGTTGTPTESIASSNAYSAESSLARMATRPTPVQAGTLNVSSRVQVVVEIQAKP